MSFIHGQLIQGVLNKTRLSSANSSGDPCCVSNLSLGINIAMRVFNGLVTLFVYVSLQNWLFAFVWVRAVAREPLSRGVSE
jgi:hypothetical protein